MTKYGSDGLNAADVADPAVGESDVLIDVRAASINPLDKMVRNGEFKQLLSYRARSCSVTMWRASSPRWARP